MSTTIREFFPGSNTPSGFYSYYDCILKSSEANRIVVLKGGPGTGKSTFMKRVAKHLVSLGYETELLHCSSDPNSLDGVCAREIGFLILDGTAPHIVDPKNPGAVDEIINLGDCWDKDKILKNKSAIIDTNEKISKNFQRAYSYLASAKNLQTQIEHDIADITDTGGIKAELEEIKKNFDLCNFSASDGMERKAFLSAITPIGMKNYIDTFAQNAQYVYQIESDFAYNSGMLLNALAKLFISRGYDIRTFYCPMSPDVKIEHIYIPSLKTFFTTQNAHHALIELDATEKIDLNLYVNSKKILIDTSTDLELCNLLFGRAVDAIASAKKLHDELEKNYIPLMDFGKVENLCRKLIESIE